MALNFSEMSWLFLFLVRTFANASTWSNFHSYCWNGEGVNLFFIFELYWYINYLRNELLALSLQYDVLFFYLTLPLLNGCGWELDKVNDKVWRKLSARWCWMGVRGDWMMKGIRTGSRTHICKLSNCLKPSLLNLTENCDCTEKSQ